MAMRRIHVIDSHTAGEPTRTVVSGFPDLGGGTVSDQLHTLRHHHDAYRSAVINEPRGHDVLVGALLCPSPRPECLTGVVFFNNTGYLGMCGHGMIGVIVTLQHLDRLQPGRCLIDTPVGVVEATPEGGGVVALTNVDAYREARDVVIQVPGYGSMTGDVAWGGNWFFLAKGTGESLELDNVSRLSDLAMRVRSAINAQGYPLVDHVEFFGPPGQPANHSRNFVLCPGGAYDRSPCGTGTSAKLACLAADGVLEEGATWNQEGILGTHFAGSFTWIDRGRGTIRPRISGRAHVTAESVLLQDPDDPFAWGIQAGAARPDAPSVA
jgi:4-hydroxyproline epimerase